MQKIRLKSLYTHYKMPKIWYKRKIERLKTEKERREWTKRLIEIGAMIESIAGGELDLYKFQSYLNQYKLAISA